MRTSTPEGRGDRAGGARRRTPSTRRRLTRTAIGALALLALAPELRAPALAQAGGSYRLRSSTIDGGGTTRVAAGSIEIGGTLGQPEAGTMTGADVTVHGGFWGAVLAPASPTATATKTASARATQTQTPSPSATDTPLPTPTTPAEPTIPGSSTHTPTALTRTATPIATAETTSPTATPTPTPPQRPPCVGDCDGSGEVTVSELITTVNIALGNTPASACPIGDRDGSGNVTVDEVVVAVTNGLEGCP